MQPEELKKKKQCSSMKVKVHESESSCDYLRRVYIVASGCLSGSTQSTCKQYFLEGKLLSCEGRGQAFPELYLKYAKMKVCFISIHSNHLKLFKIFIKGL